MTDALVWCLPAALLAVWLRLQLLWVQPYAYWGSDSGSYFWFAQRLLLEGAISLPAKRHYLYPIFLVPVTLLPGAALSALAWIQHGLGVLSVLAVGYCIRKACHGWRFWIVPLTCGFAALPLLLWYEHELIAESLFAQSMAWAFAGWMAWRGRGFASGGFLMFFLPLAVCVLTKSAGRFFWPGLLLGLLFARRGLRWPQWASIIVLLCISWTMGEKSQGVRLLYTSAFPLTNMESPLHSELKQEIAGLVEESRRNLPVSHFTDSEQKSFLRTEFKKADIYPQWAALQDDQKQLWKTVRELALEAVLSHPVEFMAISIRRVLASLDLTTFRCERFSESYFPERFESQLFKINARGELATAQIALLFGIETDPNEEPRHLLETLFPNRPSGTGTWLEQFSTQVHEVFSPVRARQDGSFHVTPLGYWLVASLVLSLMPSRFSGMGVWWLVIGGYAVGVHLLGSANPRFLVPIWPVLFVAMAIPADALFKALCKSFHRSISRP